MYYDRDILESKLEAFFWTAMDASKTYIDLGGTDSDTIYWDMDLYAPSFVFRSRGEYYEYQTIVSKWNARFRSEIDDYRRAHQLKSARAEASRREERAREEEREEEVRRQRLKREREEREREEEEERRREEEKRRKKEEARKRAEAKKKEQDKKNREELSRMQEAWRRQQAAVSQAVPSPPVAESVACPSCGAANDKSAKFCTKCGAQLKIKCPSCGEFVRVGSKFCTNCGSQLH